MIEQKIKDLCERTFEEKSQSEEWGAWKFVSEMLDNPGENEIYPTSKCYEQIHDFVVEQKQQTAEAVLSAVVEKKKRILVVTDSGEVKPVDVILLSDLTNKDV